MNILRYVKILCIPFKGLFSPYKTPVDFKKGQNGRGLTFNPVTPAEGVSSVSRVTRANRVMVDDLAPGIGAASARTGIFASLVNTGFVLGAFGADHALGSAVRRDTDKLSPARADGVVVVFPAVAVRATWRGLARVFWRFHDNYGGKKMEW